MFPEAIEYVEEYTISAHGLFEKKREENRTTTTIFRIVGFLLMFFGVVMMFAPIVYVIQWIPLVGWLIAHGVSIVVWIFSFIFSITFTSLTIGLAWLFYRPKYGIILLAVVAVGVILMFVAFPGG